MITLSEKTHNSVEKSKSAYHLFNQISRIINKKCRRQRDSMGLKEGYRHIVYHLSHGDDGATQQTLVARTHLSAPTVSVSLGRMEREEIVRRVTDSADQRSVHVFLTEKGWEMVNAMQQTHTDIEQIFSDALTDEEFEQLSVILEKVRNKLVE